MSKEFMRIAKKEINEELNHIQKLIDSAKNDKEIFHKATEIEKHFHKIKGLAPMMGQEKMGEISALIDKILKHMIEGNQVEQIYEIIIDSNKFMKKAMEDSSTDGTDLKQKIKTKYAKIVN